MLGAADIIYARTVIAKGSYVTNVPRISNVYNTPNEICLLHTIAVRGVFQWRNQYCGGEHHAHSLFARNCKDPIVFPCNDQIQKNVIIHFDLRPKEADLRPAASINQMPVP